VPDGAVVLLFGQSIYSKDRDSVASAGDREEVRVYGSEAGAVGIPDDVCRVDYEVGSVSFGVC